MKNHNRWRSIGSNLLVLLAAAIAIVLSGATAHFLPDISPGTRNWLGYLIGALFLFGVANFFRTSQKRCFASRESVVGGACLFLFLLLTAAFSSLSSHSNFFLAMSQLVGPFLVAIFAFHTITRTAKSEQSIKTPDLQNKTQHHKSDRAGGSEA